MTDSQQITQALSAPAMGVSRRSARGHSYELRGLHYVPISRLHEGRFGRMFRLAPFTPSDDRIAEIDAAMTENLVDVSDPEADPANVASADPQLENSEIPAGYAYLGQFIDHDLTFDTASSLERQNDPDALTNFRSPRFDLDCI